jgi:hypothetical protein
MNMQFRSGADQASSAGDKTAIADCDIHPARKGPRDLYPYLAKRWHEHLETSGTHPYQGMMEGPPYPKAQPNASRRDAYPPEGGPQGSSLSFMQAQHLDPNNVALGVLCPLQTGQGIRNQDLSAALATAVNEWQIAALRSWLRMPCPVLSGHNTPSATLFGSRCCACMNDSDEPCGPPSGG